MVVVVDMDVVVVVDGCGWLWLVLDGVVPGRLGSSPTQQMQT